MNDKFTIIDVTDEIIIGGFGNLEGNLGLLKYSKEDIRKMITENNNGNDNIRLINSLLQSLKELKEQYCERTDCSGRLGNSKKVEELEQENQQLKEQLQQKEDIINKIKDCVEEFLCSEYYCSQGLELHDFCVKILEILDNTGDENDG